MGEFKRGRERGRVKIFKVCVCEGEIKGLIKCESEYNLVYTRDIVRESKSVCV